jgi:hypothetical protein
MLPEILHRYGCRIFAVTNPSGNFTDIAVYMSDDGGATFSVLDAANQPTSGPSILVNSLQDGQYLRIFYTYKSGSNHDLRIKTFDMVALAWVAGEVTGGPSQVNINRLNVIDTILLSANEYFVFYTPYISSVSSDRYIYFATYIGGVWDLDNLLDPTTADFTNRNLQLGTVSVDDDYVYCLYSTAKTFSSPPQQTLWYVAVDRATWIPATPQSVSVGFEYGEIHRSYIWEGEIWAPVGYYYDGANPLRTKPVAVRALTGSTAPTWSRDDVFTDITAPDFAGWLGSMKLLPDGTTLYFIVDEGRNDRDVLYRKNVAGSGWDASSTIFYDFGGLSVFAAPYSTADGYEYESLFGIWPILDAYNDHGFTFLTTQQVVIPASSTFYSNLIYFRSPDDPGCSTCCCSDYAY